MADPITNLYRVNYSSAVNASIRGKTEHYYDANSLERWQRLFTEGDVSGWLSWSAIGWELLVMFFLALWLLVFSYCFMYPFSARVRAFFASRAGSTILGSYYKIGPVSGFVGNMLFGGLLGYGTFFDSGAIPFLVWCFAPDEFHFLAVLDTIKTICHPLVFMYSGIMLGNG